VLKQAVSAKHATPTVDNSFIGETLAGARCDLARFALR